jgi:hypothetical protein
LSGCSLTVSSRIDLGDYNIRDCCLGITDRQTREFINAPCVSNTNGRERGRVSHIRNAVIRLIVVRPIPYKRAVVKHRSDFIYCLQPASISIDRTMRDARRSTVRRCTATRPYANNYSMPVPLSIRPTTNALRWQSPRSPVTRRS